MKLIAINSVEIDRLTAEPHEVFRLYIMLRWRMDKLTKRVGERPKVSWQALKEELYVDSRNGVTRVDADRSKVRRVVARLIALGLVRQVSSGRESLVFELPLATPDRSAQKQPDTNSTHLPGNDPDQEPDTQEPAFSLALSGDYDQEPDIEPDTNSTHQPDIHQEPSNSVSKDTGPAGPANVYRLWVNLVGDTKANRGILGRMMKEFGEEAVIEAVAVTIAKQPADPVGYLRGVLRPKERGFVC